MSSPPARNSVAHNISTVALDLLRNRPVPGRAADNAEAMGEWIEKRLATGGREKSGIEPHREIEAGISGQAIPNLLIVLDISREDFSELLGRARKTLNELVPRKHLSRADSAFLYRIARAIVRAVSVFGETEYAVQWLKEPNEALGGAVPLSLVGTVEGNEILHAELGAEGLGVLYCATSESLAMLELRVHAPHPYPRIRLKFVLEISL